MGLSAEALPNSMSPNEYRKLTDEAKAEAWSRLSEDEKRAIREQESDAKAVPNAGAGAGGSTRPSARDHLVRIRDQTCYGTLRAVIEIGFWLLLVLVSVAWLFVGVEVARGRSLAFAALLIGGYPLFLAVAVAVKQSALLLVDIADAVVHQGAGKD